MLCSRCVLPESKPDIVLDEEGICNICREYEKASTGAPVGKLLETDFIKILNKHRGKHKYDCLVMCSGGKDSTASLYYMKKRYRMNPLAFTFDHGFETEGAKENVINAVEALGVDYLFFKTDFMKDMFAKIVKTGSKAVMCHPCSIWYMQLAFDIAARYEIPLIIAGRTKGQFAKREMMTKGAGDSSAPEFRLMAEATKDFLSTLKDDPKYGDFPTTMEEVLKRAKKKHKCTVLSPHWFLDTDPEEYVELIKKELNWKPPRLSYPAKSTNCSLNFLSVHLSLKYYGYTHYHVEMSKLVRQGLMTREEALNCLKTGFDKALLNRIAEKLGCEID